MTGTHSSNSKDENTAVRATSAHTSSRRKVMATAAGVGVFGSIGASSNPVRGSPAPRHLRSSATGFGDEHVDTGQADRLEGVWETDDGHTVIDRGYDHYTEAVEQDDLVGEAAVFNVSTPHKEFVLDCGERRQLVQADFDPAPWPQSSQRIEGFGWNALFESIADETGIDVGDTIQLERTWPAVEAPPDAKKRVSIHVAYKRRRFEVITAPDDNGERHTFVQTISVAFDLHMKTEVFGTCDANAYVPLEEQLAELLVTYTEDDPAIGDVEAATDRIEAAITESTDVNEDGSDVDLDSIDESLMSAKADAVEHLVSAAQHHEGDQQLASVANGILDIADETASAKLSFTAESDLEDLPNPHVADASSALGDARASRESASDQDGPRGPTWAEAMASYEEAVSSNRQAVSFYDDAVVTGSESTDSEIPPPAVLETEPVAVTDVSVPSVVETGTEVTATISFDTEAQHVVGVSILDGDDVVSFAVDVTETDGVGTVTVSAPPPGEYTLTAHSRGDPVAVPFSVVQDAESNDDVTDDDEIPGFGVVSALAGLGIAGVVLKRHLFDGTDREE